VEAADEEFVLLRQATRPVVLADVQVHRFGAQPQLRQLLKNSGYLFAVLLPGGKIILSERHPQYNDIAAWCGRKLPEAMSWSPIAQNWAESMVRDSRTSRCGFRRLLNQFVPKPIVFVTSPLFVNDGAPGARLLT
jgi:TPP-dependent 2-oxoacid decarboxylase